MPSLKCVLSVALLCTAIVFFATSANADTTYTYTSKQLTNAVGVGCLPTPCLNHLPGPFFLEGSFAVAVPLGDNVSDVFVDPTSFSFALVGSHGFILTQADSDPPFSPQFNFWTNSSGNIDQWNLGIDGSGPDPNDIFTLNIVGPHPVETDEGIIGNLETDVSNQNNPGAWTVSTSGTSVPEPSSALLLGVALLGVAGLAFVKKPILRGMTSAFCFYLLMTLCAVSAKADTTYTYTGPQFTEFGAASCPPTCNITGSFTLPTPIPANANATISTFAFSAAPYTFTSLTNGPFGVSTNAAGVIDNWDIDMIDMLGNGEIAEILSGAPKEEDLLEFGAPNPPNGLKFFMGADSFGIGVWTSSTSTGVPEPASGTLLIAGVIALTVAFLKKG